MANTSERIINDLKFDGIYYDQIAAVPPTPCYDRSHNHPMGGGHHWQKGNSALFQETRNKIDNKGFIMSEDNNEVYIGDVDIFLTLFAFRRANIPFLGQKDISQTYKIVPAYQSIYDGFAMFAGAELNKTYFENPDIFAKKMGGQFMMGTQMSSYGMGWEVNPNVSA